MPEFPCTLLSANRGFTFSSLFLAVRVLLCARSSNFSARFGSPLLLHRSDSVPLAISDSSIPGCSSPGFIYTLHGPLQYHTFSTALLVLWTGFIAFAIVVQELAIRHSRTLPPQRPWYADSTLPLYSVLRTVFAQAHGPITGMHLARLAVGSLHARSRGGPRTWMELFWLSDRRWSGPVGVSLSLWTSTRRRIRISTLFIALCVLSSIALATPIFFSRAYEAQKSGSGERYAASSMSVLSLESLASGSAVEQLELGWKRWRKADGASVVELFPRTTYVAQSKSWSSSASDLFFAGELLGNDARQSGVRFRGACVPVDAGADIPHDMATFRQYCEHNLGSSQRSLGEGQLFVVTDHTNPHYQISGNSHQTRRLPYARPLDPRRPSVTT